MYKTNKIYIIIILIILLSLASIMKYKKINIEINRDMEVDIPVHIKFDYLDTNGGFHGDGILLAKAKVKDFDIDKLFKENYNFNTKNYDEFYQNNIEWIEIYFKENKGFNSDMSQLKNGYWLFLDKFNNTYSEENNYKVDTNNFSSLVLDLDKNIIYYIKFDS